ncbi:hypothetical protein [Pseudomonas aeruginosa]|uniref:hypothetical protein n=1 Tax=Pseudomonas aeruginosa TaxID=287 RepID=UPI000DF91277|nr:hypothetical protein [Pseudomonas aeruginosa]MCO1759686.1 hypothetical protein [Pseudomonas aeruginosa]MCS7936212.1 hypothetical protein [Pseudomonas aeruginosa]MCV4034359.1 hypothetical protein [Pseudomonas aeruginosa]QYE72360.1 hypothetical protein KZ798_03755 [Pseudomonas aeruginosa]RCN04589.1 hypothetical protein C3O68_03034 [Pseudomonas aeruginosa]
MRNNLPAKNLASGRDAADILRVRFWYEGVRQRAGMDSAYELEQLFEPESFRRRPKDGKPCHRCKWQRYREGRHTPQNRLAERVNAQLPGAIQELRHPLWDVLKLKPNRSALSEAILQRLMPDVLAVLYEPVGGTQVYWQRAPVARTLIARLERIASLDALAALVWLLFEALAQDHRERANNLVRGIYAVLLMLGIWWQERQLADSMMALFAERILPLAAPQYLRFNMSSQDLVKASAGLNLVVYNTDVSQHSDLPWQQRVRIMRNLLSGHFGLDVASAFSPVYALASCESQEAPPAVIEQLRLDEQLRAWGWNCILAGRDEAFPPSNISLK